MSVGELEDVRGHALVVEVLDRVDHDGPAGPDAPCVLTGPSVAVRSVLGKTPRRRTGRSRRANDDAAWLTAHWL